MAQQRTRKTAKPAALRKKRKTSQAGPSLLKFEIIGLCCIFFGIFSTLGIVGVDTGSIGHGLDSILSYGFGMGRIVVSLTFLVAGLRYIVQRRAWPFTRSWLGGCWGYILLLTGIHLVFIPSGTEFMPLSLSLGGGLFGAVIASILREWFGLYGADLVWVGSAAVTVLIWKQWSISQPVAKASVKASEEVTKMSDKAVEGLQGASAAIKEWHRPRIFDLQKEGEQEHQKSTPLPPEHANAGAIAPAPADLPEEEREEPARYTPVYTEDQEPLTDQDIDAMAEEEPEVSEHTAPAGAVQDVLEEEMAHLKPVEVEPVAAAADMGPTGASAVPKARGESTYRLPPMSILHHGKEQSGGVSDEVRHNARILQETLQSFNIDAKILNASQGPAVTRYEIEPAAGVKVSKIVHLADDLALKLAATDIRIEAPIPGKAAVGIEVPNQKLAGVMLRDVLDTEAFRRATGGVPVSLGKDIAGNPVIADLTKMPHLLVAGSTGSGKSVCINTFIASILFKQRPEDVKMILIDPKVVELSNYNGLPHLLTPVVTDPKKAASVLRWAVREMDDRYKRFALTKTRDIGRYNETHPEDAMPFVVIIIDELADLMMVASNDVEESICRLAQKARACGMHLVLATQRPSVDVLTGLIKANVPSRIAFAVSSQVDSRTILDMAGAERLIGKGDMLYYPMGASKPLRVQGAFISDSEIDEMVEFIKAQGAPQYDESVQKAQSDGDNGGIDFFEDELMSQAIDMVLETGQASASMLQRRFRIGYTRAARLVDTMEAMGIVGANNGSKAREILMTADEVQQKYFNV
ncbi:DNA translocase FtsK [uncultured Megasphaera sp.]|uniref:FtsK/SpoIIIE family DNA translocase n=1 Tax=uncultured Megasphaera sp. TaxID=165188 RepID=UPI00265B0F84|nr:DNA translocase FtsK [uncultured Megasphaera sp.]